MELQDFFYYGFQSQKRQDKTRFEDDMKVLEEILEDKAILSRKGLNKKRGLLQRLNIKRLNWQGTDSVSVCVHPFRARETETIQQAETRDWHDAFPYFVGQCLSFVLSDEILKNAKPNVSKAMRDEIQICGNIALEHIVGLGVPTSYLEKYGSKDSIVRIKRLLKKYELEIPVYDIRNNREYVLENEISSQGDSIIQELMSKTQDILAETATVEEGMARTTNVGVKEAKTVKEDQQTL